MAIGWVTTVWIIAGIFFVVAFVTGWMFGSFYGNKTCDGFQESAISTCEYSNKLTTLANKQSELLTLYTGTNYTTLQELNCSLLEK